MTKTVTTGPTGEVRSSASPRVGKTIGSALGLSCLLGCVGQVGNSGGPQGDGGVVFEDPPPTPQELCAESGGPDAPPNASPSPLRRLTQSEYKNSIRDLLGVDVIGELPSDERLDIYYTNSTALLGELDVQRYADAAEKLAQAPVKLPCKPTDIGEAACGRKFIETFGRRLFRRPLTSAQVQKYVDGPLAVGTTEGGFDNGIRLVTEAMLQSPEFLYHVEIVPMGSPDAVPLTPWEVAARLSYTLWASTPDDALLDAAADGALADPQAIRAHAERMLEDPRAERGLSSFVLQWMGLSGFEKIEKDQTEFPEFTPELRGSMLRETERFATHVVLHDDGLLSSLLGAPISFLDGPLGEFYGVTPNADPLEPTSLNPEQRGGLLTLPAVMAKHAHAKESSPVVRGKMVREALMCQTLKPPPPNISELPPPDPQKTMRDRLAEHRANEVCAVCHDVIDPPGLAFENYDAIGRYRTQENNIDIDASGELTNSDVGGRFTTGRELVTMLGQSEDVAACVVLQYFRYSLGRIEAAQDACSVASSQQRFFDSGKNVKELLLSIITSDAFRYARGAQ